jgi:hypothetical protein
VSVELARRYGNALDAENWDEARALLDPEVEIVRPSGRRYEGADRWIGMISQPGGFQNIKSEVASRSYEQRNGRVYEVKDMVHQWTDDGSLAYTSREETCVTCSDGRIVRLESTVEHHEP